MIYLDNSATTKPYPEVVQAFQTVAEQYFGNPSSLHDKGVEAEELLEKARHQISLYLGVNQKEVIFTSGGTEGNNLAIKGIAFQHKKRGNHLITSVIEHPSSYEAFKQLEQTGFDVTYLPVDKSGLISLDDLEKAIREDTILVSLIHVNNEIGTIQPVEEIGELLSHYPKIFFHVDHVQGASKVPLHVNEANIDLCTISGHKIHGLKGTGVLTVREGVTLWPLLNGGGQEKGFRSGTENVAGIVSLAKAIRLSYEQARTELDKLAKLNDYARKELDQLPEVEINTPKRHAAPHILNFSIKQMKPEVFIHSLAEQDIYVSTKSACSSKSDEASRIVLALGAGEERAKTAIRISFSFDTTREEIAQFLSAVESILREYKKRLGGP